MRVGREMPIGRQTGMSAPLKIAHKGPGSTGPTQGTDKFFRTFSKRFEGLSNDVGGPWRTFEN